MQVSASPRDLCTLVSPVAWPVSLPTGAGAGRAGPSWRVPNVRVWGLEGQALSPLSLQQRALPVCLSQACREETLASQTPAGTNEDPARARGSCMRKGAKQGAIGPGLLRGTGGKERRRSRLAWTSEGREDERKRWVAGRGPGGGVGGGGPAPPAPPCPALPCSAPPRPAPPQPVFRGPGPALAPPLEL